MGSFMARLVLFTVFVEMLENRRYPFPHTVGFCFIRVQTGLRCVCVRQRGDLMVCSFGYYMSVAACVMHMCDAVVQLSNVRVCVYFLSSV